MTVAEIAPCLGRHRSMVCRRDTSGCYHVSAQGLALAQRRRLAKLARHADLLAHVVDRLRAE